LSPRHDPTRGFRLCWHHHHGCYDQGYISTMNLLKVEDIWIEKVVEPDQSSRSFR
jgi:hypothetical protein